jgi:hypothetical protein
MVASLFAIDLPGNQPGAIGLPAKPIAPGFSVVSKEKSKSGRPRKTFGNMRFYEFLYVFMRSPITFKLLKLFKLRLANYRHNIDRCKKGPRRLPPQNPPQ